MSSPGNCWGTVSPQTLSAGQTLTGIGELNSTPSMMVAALVVGGPATLYVDMSVDGGMNYDGLSSFPLSDGVGRVETLTKGSRMVRVRLTAGANNLTAVRIQTDFGNFDQQASGASSAQPVALPTNAILSTGQKTLSTSAQQVLAANSARLFAEVTNADSSITSYVGKDNTVTASNGHVVKPGASFDFDGYLGAIWAIAASGSPILTYVEW